MFFAIGVVITLFGAAVATEGGPSLSLIPFRYRVSITGAELLIMVIGVLAMRFSFWLDEPNE